MYMMLTMEKAAVTEKNSNAPHLFLDKCKLSLEEAGYKCITMMSYLSF